jgi:hypothetical protein
MKFMKNCKYNCIEEDNGLDMYLAYGRNAGFAFENVLVLVCSVVYVRLL